MSLSFSGIGQPDLGGWRLPTRNRNSWLRRRGYLWPTHALHSEVLPRHRGPAHEGRLITVLHPLRVRGWWHNTTRYQHAYRQVGSWQAMQRLHPVLLYSTTHSILQLRCTECKMRLLSSSSVTHQPFRPAPHPWLVRDRDDSTDSSDSIHYTAWRGWMVPEDV